MLKNGKYTHVHVYMHYSCRRISCKMFSLVLFSNLLLLPYSCAQRRDHREGAVSLQCTFFGTEIQSQSTVNVVLADQ